MSLNPKNPILAGQHAPSLGKTQWMDGQLKWFDSNLDVWRPAVRQYTIRDRLLRQARMQGTYRFPRGAGHGNNVTAPLASDLNDGGDWANRPDRLFQLEPNQLNRKVEPKTVLVDDDGRVMLDPYDHPIRNFGNELPIIISSEIQGWEVENYLRRNHAIKVYDLVARCPKYYDLHNKMHTQPPRIQTLRERATKFREKAGLLAWENRLGSGHIRDFIIGLLPPGATSTKWLGHDLTKSQLAARKALSAGKCPNKRRKAKREAETKAQKAADRIVKKKAAGTYKKKRPANVCYTPAQYSRLPY